MSGPAEVEILECFEATRRIEPRGQLVRQSFILNEALLTGGPNGLFIETFGLQFPAVQASNLRAYQGGSVREVFLTMLRPEREALVMFGQRPGMLPSLVRSCRIRRGRSRERSIEVIVGLLEQTAGSREKRSCPRGRSDCLCITARIKAGLQLTNPIPTDNEGPTGPELPLEAGPLETVSAKRAELPRQSPQRPDETELRRHN